MTMFGTAAKSQYNHYFPGYYLDLDLNAIPNGSSCTLNDEVKILNNDHGYDRFSSSADLHLEYNKEVLKQTMLKHEAIFKDQIYELHYLYKRQRELMDEIRKNSIEKDHLVLEKAHPNLVFSHTSSGYAPESTEASVSALENTLAHSGFNEGRFKQVGPNLAQTEYPFVDSGPLKSKCMKSRKILFDLELPADAYINSGEGVSVEEESDDEVLEMPCYSCKPTSKVVNDSTKSIFGSGGLNSVSLGGTATPDSLPRTINSITDLNKPIDVGVESASGSDDFSGNTNSSCQAVSKNMTDAHTSSNFSFSLRGAYTESVFRSSQSAHVRFNATPEPPTSSLLDKTSGNSCSEKAKRDLESSGRNHEHLKNIHLGSAGAFDTQSSQVVPHVDRTKSLVSPWKYYMDDSGRNPIAVQALPCFTNSVKLANSSKRSNLSKELTRGRIQHRNSSPSSGNASFLQDGLSNCSQPEISASLSRFNRNTSFGLASKRHGSQKNVKSPNPPGAKSTKYLNLNLILDSCDPDVAVSHDVNLVSGKQGFENSGIGIRFKNNLSVCRDHIDLNSCINEDDSSLTSTSLINLKAPPIPEKQECSGLRGESDENQLEIPFQQSGHQDGNVDQELARSAAEAIVFISSSVAESCQEKVAASSLPEVSSSGSLLWFAGIVVSSQAAETENSFDYKKCPSEETDYFEAMTLNLTETKVEEEYWQKGSDQKQPLPNQVKRERSRKRRQHKDFQNEVLPGIASLSRNEVSKDLQTIVGLIENDHACGTSLSRHAGRARGKRGSFNPCVDETESITRATQKQKTSNSKMGLERSLIGWGKITRGPRRQRHPASKPLHF